MSLPVRGEWIEIVGDICGLYTGYRSLPVRGEWIEMPEISKAHDVALVSPREGRVD